MITLILHQLNKKKKQKVLKSVLTAMDEDKGKNSNCKSLQVKFGLEISYNMNDKLFYLKLSDLRENSVNFLTVMQQFKHDKLYLFL